MKFTIAGEPPGDQELVAERDRVRSQIRLVKTHDTLIAVLLIAGSSVVLGLAVFWTTRSIRDAAIASAIFPVIGVVLTLAGLVTNAGFRSTAMNLVELNNSLIALNPVSEQDKAEVAKLGGKYQEVEQYLDKLRELDREPVNGELALFWEWDASTEAKQGRRQELMDRARSSVQMDDEDAG